MQLIRRLKSSVVVLSLCLPSFGLAQSSVNISQDLLGGFDLPNAAGQYGQTLIVDRTGNGVLVGGFTFPTHSLPEGSFVVTPARTFGAEPTVHLFTAGPDCTWTAAQAVNRHPAIVGWCYIRTATLETVEGFYRSESGKVTRLRYPGARFTEAHAVNDNHVVVGWYETWSGEMHGFRWNRSTNQYASVDAPFAGVTATIPLAVTKAGHIGVTYLAPNTTGIALLRNGQWSTLTVPSIALTQLEDLSEDGRVLGWAQRPNEAPQPFIWEQGVVTLLTWPTRHVQSTHARGLSGNLVVGHVEWELPVPQAEPPPAAETIVQGFVARLDALRGEVVTPPPPGNLARGMPTQMVQASAETAAGAPAAPSCPDEAPAPGTPRGGRLAQSWVRCARLR